jgi:hypothetical protein
MASATSLRPNSPWFGRDRRSRQVPQLASSFVAKLIVPGTDPASADAAPLDVTAERIVRLLTEGR